MGISQFDLNLPILVRLSLCIMLLTLITLNLLSYKIMVISLSCVIYIIIIISLIIRLNIDSKYMKEQIDKRIKLKKETKFIYTKLAYSLWFLRLLYS